MKIIFKDEEETITLDAVLDCVNKGANLLVATTVPLSSGGNATCLLTLWSGAKGSYCAGFKPIDLKYLPQLPYFISTGGPTTPVKNLVKESIELAMVSSSTRNVYFFKTQEEFADWVKSLSK